MRKAFYVFSIVAAAALATPALAQPYGYDPQYNPDAPAAAATGAVVGTAAGVAIYNGALGSGAFAAALPTTAAGAAAVGGVAGVGTDCALVDAVVQPCRWLSGAVPDAPGGMREGRMGRQRTTAQNRSALVSSVRWKSASAARCGGPFLGALAGL